MTIHRQILGIIGGILLTGTALGQAIDPTASFRTVDANTYLRLHYENDFFTDQDLYYTQGINMEFVHPLFQRFFVSKVLISGGDHQQVGIAIEHNGYTPTSTSSDAILYGDRPFAAALMFKTFAISRFDSLHKRITSSLTLGVIGPAAGGKAMQSTIHQWVNDAQPLGWQNQIHNDVVINYEVGMERSLFKGSKAFLVTAFGTLHAGTLSTKLSSGIVFMAGRINPRIASVFGSNSSSTSSTKQRKLTFHFYWQPLVNVVGYDATLQGGVFNNSSPYTISADDLTRFTFQSNIGLVMNVGKVYLEYFNTFLTKEFETGLSHKWGGLRVGARL